MKKPGPPVKWTMEKMRFGFEDFYKTNNRWPTADEIDKYKILPSSRQIQRKWGGLKKLREKLGIPILDYTSGSARSDISRLVGARGKASEAELQKFLVSYFGEVFVHIEKPFDTRRHYVDFFVYAKNYSFGVDAFFPATLSNLGNIIVIKQNNYEQIPFDVYFVSMNPEISQDDIGRLMLNKKKKLNSKISVVSFNQLKKVVMQFEPLESPQNLRTLEERDRG